LESCSVTEANLKVLVGLQEEPLVVRVTAGEEDMVEGTEEDMFNSPCTAHLLHKSHMRGVTPCSQVVEVYLVGSSSRMPSTTWEMIVEKTKLTIKVRSFLNLVFEPTLAPDRNPRYLGYQDGNDGDWGGGGDFGGGDF
jgi:hypothetical protein